MREERGRAQEPHLPGPGVQDEDGDQWQREHGDLVAEEGDRLGEPEVAKLALPQERHPTTVSGLIVPPSACPTATSSPSPAQRAVGPLPRSRDRPPVADEAELVLVEAPLGEVDERGEKRQHALRLGFLHPERADGRAPEPAAVPAERVRDRPHVRPAGDVEVDLGQRRLVADDPQRMDGRAAQRHLHRDSLPVEFVGALAADLDGGGRGHRQLHVAFERGDLGFARDRRLLDDLALTVAGRRAQPEADLGAVALVQADEVAREPGAAPEEDEQEPGRERVEGARVPCLRPVASAQVGDDRERGRPCRLVDQNEARCRLRAPQGASLGAGRGQLGFGDCSRNSRRMKSTISSVEDSLEKPAA